MRLTIREAPPPSPPDLAEPSVTVWCENGGAVCAYGYIRDGSNWMHIPRVAAFQFDGEDSEVNAMPEAAAPREVVVDAFHRTVLPMALQARGREVLHASAALSERGLIALCAVSETGKSTLAYGLCRRGHRLWADDAVALDTDCDPVMAIPLPFTLRLRPESAEFFGRNGGPVNSAAELVPEEAAVPLAAVCVIERDASATPVEVERLAPAEAFPTVLTHGYCFSLVDNERNAAMMRHYLELVDRTPVFRLRVRAGLEELPAILDAIEQTAGVV